MGKSSKQITDGCARIKGYLPVRVIIPEPPIGSGPSSGDSKHDDAETTSSVHDSTFFFVREHRDNNNTSSTSNNTKQGGNNTLFIANAPVVPGIKTKLLLKCILGRYGEVERITLVENPRKQQPTTSSTTSADWEPFFPSFQGPIHASEKFAHAVFVSSKHMRKTLQAMEDIMATRNDDDDTADLPGIQLTKLDLKMLREETDRQHRVEMGFSDSDDEMDDKEDTIEAKPQKEATGILALAQRYRASCQRCCDRQKLLDKCNEIMQDYEDAEEAQRLDREAAANQPDEDGFISVTSKSIGLEESKEKLEKDKTGRRHQKRNRKKKESTGATELQDFYRFQRKETRKRTLQDLRKQFEEDLKKVKKMKEERKYAPF
jgi:ribosomal RNA-processing protein 7